MTRVWAGPESLFWSGGGDMAFPDWAEAGALPRKTRLGGRGSFVRVGAWLGEFSLGRSGQAQEASPVDTKPVLKSLR